MEKSNYTTFSLQLAGEEDLLLGKGSQEQTRFSGNRKITKLTLLKPVDNINELKALDTSKYMYALCIGLYDTHDENNGYFYYFDPYSEEEEDIPHIISPSLGSGRWKYIPYALDLIKKSVKNILEEYINTTLPILVNDEVVRLANEIVPEKIEELLQTEIPELVTTEVQSVVFPELAKAGYYEDKINYKQGQFNDIFLCNTSTKQFKVRRYVLSRIPNGESLQPVQGNEAYNMNGVKAFYDNDSLNENKLYKRVTYDNSRKIKWDIAGTNPFMFVPETVIKISNKFLGKLTFKLFSALQTTPVCSFDLNIYSMSGESQELRFSNVFYSKRLKQLSVTNQRFSYLSFAGFCFYTQMQGSEYNLYMYFDTTFRLNFTYMYVESEEYFDDTYFVETMADIHSKDGYVDNITTQIYAVREGGGSDIEGMGCIFQSLRKEQIGLESYDYYLFRNGFVAWDEAITLPYYFTAYNINTGKLYASLAVDPSDRYLANVGTIHGNEVGIVQDCCVPNAVAQWALMDDDAWNNNTYAFDNMYNISAYMADPEEDINCFQSIRKSTTTAKKNYSRPAEYSSGLNAAGAGYPVVNYLGNIARIDLSRSSPVYKYGCSSVETNRIITKFCVRAF